MYSTLLVALVSSSLLIFQVPSVRSQSDAAQNASVIPSSLVLGENSSMILGASIPVHDSLNASASSTLPPISVSALNAASANASHAQSDDALSALFGPITLNASDLPITLNASVSQTASGSGNDSSVLAVPIVVGAVLVPEVPIVSATGSANDISSPSSSNNNNVLSSVPGSGSSNDSSRLPLPPALLVESLVVPPLVIGSANESSSLLVSGSDNSFSSLSAVVHGNDSLQVLSPELVSAVVLPELVVLAANGSNNDLSLAPSSGGNFTLVLGSGNNSSSLSGGDSGNDSSSLIVSGSDNSSSSLSAVGHGNDSLEVLSPELVSAVVLPDLVVLAANGSNNDLSLAPSSGGNFTLVLGSGNNSSSLSAGDSGPASLPNSGSVNGSFVAPVGSSA